MVTNSRSMADGLYGEVDPRELTAYKIRDVANYLNMPPSTLRCWVKGQAYKTKTGDGWFQALIVPPAEGGLSFMNLLEAHVLVALRRQRYVPMQDIRAALRAILRKDPGVKYPLATKGFSTVGKTLFVEEAGRNITHDGQAAFSEYLNLYLKRIEHQTDRAGSGGLTATRLYPFPRSFAGKPNAPKSVVIDARLAFGRPVLAGTRIPTAVIAQRLITGETPEEIAKDYNRKVGEILDAIRWELAPAA
jgi:uncharacterized protein (DUF433 family)